MTLNNESLPKRDKDRHVVEQDLKLLGVYVEKVSGGDAAILASSGFVAAPPRVVRAAQPLEQPFFRSIDHGNSGQVLVFAKPVAKARTYDIRYAPLVKGVPGDWTTVTVTSARKPVTIGGLTPGTTYAFQVRALGRLGATDWSDSATRLASLWHAPNRSGDRLQVFRRPQISTFKPISFHTLTGHLKIVGQRAIARTIPYSVSTIEVGSAKSLPSGKEA